MLEKKIAVLLIDADGVLLKKEALFSERLAVHQKIPKSEINAFFEKEFKDCLLGRADVSRRLKKYLKIWKWDGSVEDLLSFWHEGIEPDSQLFDWALSLRKRGLLVYLATNNEKRRVRALSEKLGLGRKFDGVFSSASLGAVKPGRDFYGKAFGILRKMRPEISKSQVILIDDDSRNARGAREFGFNAIRYLGFARLLKTVGRKFPELT